MTEISTVARITSGGTPDTTNPEYWNGDIAWITPKDLGKPRAVEVSDSERKITKEAYERTSAKLVPTGTVLLSCRAPIGHLAIAAIPLSTNQGIKNIICSDSVDGRFLFHMLRGSIDELESMGRGNTFKEIPASVVGAFAIPAPPLDIQRMVAQFLDIAYLRTAGRQVELPELPGLLGEQRRIVARIEALAAKVEEARGLRRHAVAEGTALLRSALHRTLDARPAASHLGRVLLSPPRNGWSAKCDGAEGGAPVLSLGAVTGFRYRSTEYKRTSQPTAPGANYWLNPGDLLITRSNTPELVGHAAIYSGNPAPCIYPDLMMRLDVDETQTSKRFVHWWLQSGTAREYIAKTAKGTSPTMKKISQGIVMSLPFPESLSLDQQRRIVAYLDEVQAKVDAVKRRQAETAAELEALLPSILDRAFKGEL